MKKAISWRRVSTQKQGRSGLGLEAQKKLVNGHIQMQGYECVADYCETYTGTHLSECSELRKAIEHCKRIGATLFIAKTDRFRNAAEALTIYDELDGNIYFCDAPSQDKMILTIMFAIYEREALNISIRTQASLSVIQDNISTNGHHVSKSGRVITRLGRPKSDKFDSDLEAARAKSNETNRAKAKSNENNIRFEKWLTLWESKHGVVDRYTDLMPILDEVNALGYTTSTGMPFNKQSLRQMIYRTKERIIS